MSSEWENWLNSLPQKVRTQQKALRRQEPSGLEPSQYYLLYLPAFSGGLPQLEVFPLLTSLVDRVRYIRANALPEDLLFMFCGYRLQLSKGPLPYLVMPNMQPIPLFDPHMPMELASDGSICGGSELPVITDTTEEDLYEYVNYYSDELVADPGQFPQVFEEPPG